jgi:predicted lipoprotein with Yx(FWY)xxD motif
MRKARGGGPIPHPIRTPVLALAIVVVAALAATAAAAPRTKTVAKQAANEAVGAKVLTTTSGRTLYSLSVEHRGHFICVGGCLATWRPLLVAKGVKPSGPVRLGVLKRPDGKRQVAYRGKPLYRFAGDTAKGQAHGEGIMDVGTWHAAVTGPLASQPEAQPSPPASESEPQPPYPYPYP